jgi:uncharacterized protein
MSSTQGFASMTPDKRREVAAKGGKMAHQLGMAHKWTSEEAVIAGRKGGRVKGYRGTGIRRSREEVQ